MPLFNRLTRAVVPNNSAISRGFRSTAAVSYKKTLEQLHKEKPNLLKDARVLVRVDFNVPLSKEDGVTITDDTRIREALPTINFLINAGSKVMLVSHCGRPKGIVKDSLRMNPMSDRLSVLLNKKVNYITDCIGLDVDEAVKKLKSGDVLLLENARFYKEEEKNESAFAKSLAKNTDVFVNDAFGTAHRAHASTEGVTHFVDYKVAGFLLEKEIKFLKGAVDAPKRPFAAIVGGAKVSTKIPVIESLIDKCDKIFIGGGMIFTFYRAMGLSVGKSMVEEEFIPVAKALIEKAAKKGVKFLLPTDVVIADEFKAEANSKVIQDPTSLILRYFSIEFQARISINSAFSI